MKIYIVAHTIRGGGAETYLRGLLPCLVDKMRNTQFKMLIPSSRSNHYNNISSRFVLEEISDKNLDSTIKRLIFDNLKLPKLVKEFHPDLIFSASEIVSPKLKENNIPIVLVYHSTLQFYLKPSESDGFVKLWYTRFMRKQAAKIADIIISVSHYERAEVGMRFQSHRYGKSAVIYHGIDHDAFYPLRENEIVTSMFSYSYIVCVSDYHEHKKMDEMIEIYKKMVDLGIHEHLLIVGRVKNINVFHKMEYLIDKYDLRDRVHIEDYIDNSKLRGVYLNSRLYWTHSNAESFGLTPLEAMSCKIPVFAPWREALPEIYGDSVKFYNPFIDSIDDIARKGYSLLSSNAELKKYGELGYKHSQQFSWDKASIEYKKIFLKLIQDCSIKC